jgi:hypothetical protein
VAEGGKKKSTPEKRALILWALLVQENAGAFQNALKPEPTKADRLALEGDGLIKSEMRQRRIWIEVTDRGWAWAGSNLGAPLPAGSPAGSQILQAWLIKLKTFMEAENLALAEILSPPKRSSDSTTSMPISRDSYDAVRARVRETYFDLAGGRLNTRVLLSDLRHRLKDIDRATLDEALGRMHLEEGTTLSGLNNPQEITMLIRDSGLSFKGEAMYALWITK